ncbi:glycosyltransferase family 39 protein [Haloarcula sp. 1CSR25-25]|uniref:glycosyltransferase family 39 protein n=1 Tax=Haloarcula sp. 1CSR25-25 TaxID=2862545 RepID=UPI002894D526|nr:glycosyltransferase family 39 protein [Haloarcula sp. 1CSR25-25]MDT3435041.1 glycosyltransferase family 39 protein [Haloarcula sp. 1CSR25-25]
MPSSPWNRIRESVRREPFVPVIALAALLLMIFGTWRLRPHLTFPDETGAIELALRMGYEQNPFIDNFRKGGNLHLYLLALSFVPVTLYWLVTGQFGDIISGAASVGSSPSWGVSPDLLTAFYDVLFAGRLVSVLFGVGTVVVVYYLGRELLDRRAGMFASVFLATSVGYVLTAHYATEDVPMTFFLMLGFLLTVRAFHSGDTRTLLAAALVAGLAASTKATAGLLVLPIAIVIIERHWSESGTAVGFVKAAWKYPTLTILGYVSTTPSIFVHPVSWADEISRYVVRSTSDVSYNWSDPGWLIQLAHLAEGQGIALFLFSVLSVLLVVAFLLRGTLDSAVWLLLLYAIPYFSVIIRGNMTQFPRVMPLFPILAVLAGLAGSELTRSTRSVRVVGIGLLTLVVVFSGVHTAVGVSDFSQSRQEATAWTHANLDSSDTVDVYSQRVYLPEFPEEATVNRYVIHSSFPREEWQPGLDRLDCNAPDYVVLSSYHYFRFFKDPSVFPSVTERMSALFAEEDYEIVRTFGPPVDTELSAERKFRDSAGLSSFPEDGNPTIVVLKRIDDEPTC